MKYVLEEMDLTWMKDAPCKHWTDDDKSLSPPSVVTLEYRHIPRHKGCENQYTK